VLLDASSYEETGNKGLPVVHSWPQIRICVKDIVS